MKFPRFHWLEIFQSRELNNPAKLDALVYFASLFFWKETK